MPFVQNDEFKNMLERANKYTMIKLNIPNGQSILSGIGCKACINFL